MSEEMLKKVSKRLSYVLRHRPDTIDLELGDGGWLIVDELLLGLASHGTEVSRDLLERVVAENDKQRFEFSDDRLCIRARQGHSAEVELGYEPAVPPDVLYHGTASRHLDSILEQGLLKGSRHHVHMSTNRETMLQVAIRHGKPVLLAIDARQMHEDGHAFFVTENQVWLTDTAPPEYLTVIEQ